MAADHEEAWKIVKPSCCVTVFFFCFFITHPIHAFDFQERRAPERDGLPLPQFDGGSAYTFVLRQLDFGPRVPGSTAHATAVDAYEDWFLRCGADVRVETFPARMSAEPDTLIALADLTGYNIRAEFGPIGTPMYLFGAHYDSRSWSDHEINPDRMLRPTPGANHNAAGVAVLLELARVFAEEIPPVTVEIILFDFRDQGIAGKSELWLQGSRHYARHRAGEHPLGAIILETVGSRGLQLQQEGFSLAHAQPWTDYVFRIAAETSPSIVSNGIRPNVYSDQVPLLRQGIPTCLFTDAGYPFTWTLSDDAAQVSPETLQKVGNVLVELVYNR